MSNDDMSPPRHTQLFDVVLLKEGKHQLNADPEDFLRVQVTAADPVAALLSDEVEAAGKGYNKLFAASPGQLTEPEILARRRKMDPPTCRSCMQAPCGCKR